jgi:hypothetical protein
MSAKTEILEDCLLCTWRWVLRWTRLAMVLTVVGSAMPQMAGAAARTPAIWFGPLDWFVRPWSGVRGPADYMQLFETKPGQAVLAEINAFIVGSPFLKWVSDADLRTIISGLQRKHISLVLEGGLLSRPGVGDCGRSVEGYAPPNEAAGLANRIAKLGGTVAYVAMDEPAFYGHTYSGRNACHSSYADLAANAAENIRAVKAIFPRVEVGDVEPVGPSPGNSLIAGYQQWTDAFQHATGERLSFFRADVQWHQHWQQPLKLLAEMLRRQGIPLGIIYNGFDDDKSDRAWAEHAEQHFREVEDRLNIIPDLAVFQSWVPHPSRMLPANDPGSYTYLLGRYLADRRR